MSFDYFGFGLRHSISFSFRFRSVPAGHSALSPPPYDFGALLTSYTQVSDTVAGKSVRAAKFILSVVFPFSVRRKGIQCLC